MVDRPNATDEKPDSGVNITGDGPGRKIGNGVVVADVATVVTIGWLVFTDHLGADIGVMAFLGMFVMVFAGDMAIQWLDMNGRAEEVDEPRVDVGSPGD